MSKTLWIKKLGIPAGVAGIATGALAWHYTGQSGNSATYQPTAHYQAAGAPGAGGMPACCPVTGASLDATGAPTTAATTPATTVAATESAAVCPMGYTSEDPAAPKP